MTLQRFQQLLGRIDPRLRVRRRGTGDIVGLFSGVYGRAGYICRLSQGELHLNGFRYMLPDPDGNLRMVPGPIQKRGRKTVINLLRNYRWITNHKQRTMLTLGIDYPDEEVRGLAGYNQYGPRT